MFLSKYDKIDYLIYHFNITQQIAPYASGENDLQKLSMSIINDIYEKVKLKVGRNG